MFTSNEIQKVTVRGRNAAETRAAILREARVLFAQAGFDRTSVRAIAKAAGCDAVLIYRYFGTKNDLFIEAVNPELALPDVVGLPIHLAVTQLLEHFFKFWEDDPTFIGLLRASANSPEAVEVMRAYFTGRIMPKLEQVIPDFSVQRAALVGSFIIGLAWTRYILKNPALAVLSREEFTRLTAPALLSLVS